MALQNYFMKLEEVAGGLDKKDPWPTKEDLAPDRIHIDQKAYSDIHFLLQNYRLCLLEGAERRGKTTLARFVGSSYADDWYVAQVDVTRVEDTNDIIPFITMLEKSQDVPRTLFIIEDCHMKPEITRAILRAAERSREASFLFTMRIPRPGTSIELDDPFDNSVIREQGWVVCLEENDETICSNITGITEKFLKLRESDLWFKSSQAAPTPDDYGYLVRQTDGNKRLLKYYLEAWANLKDPGLSISNVNRRLILDQFHKERVGGLTEVQLEVLLLMSVLAQFEVPIIVRPLFPSPVSKLDFGRAADELNNLKGFAFRTPRGEWLLADTEARLTLECMEYLKRIDNSFVYKVLSTYVKEAPNYWQVFHALHRASEKDLLSFLAGDAEVCNVLVDRLGQAKTSLDEMLYVLRAIGWSDTAKALNLWQEYKNACGQEFLQEVQRKVAQAQDIRLTALLLAFLKKVARSDEAIPLTTVLSARLLISQIQLEVTGFAWVATMMTLLNNLAPRKAKEVMSGLGKSDFLRLGEKARRHNPQTIMWFLHWIARYAELEKAAEAFLEGLGLEAISEMIVSTDFAVAVQILDFLGSMAPGKAREALSSLDEEDCRKLAKSAKKSTLQKINWFLRRLSGDEESRKFGIIFLEAIGETQLIELIRSSNLGIFKTFEQCARKVGWEGLNKLTERADFPWDQLMENSNVNDLLQALYTWLQSHDSVLRRQRKTVTQRWVAKVGASYLKMREQVEPARLLSRLLYYLYYLLDEDTARAIAMKVIEAFDPVNMQYTLEGATYLMKNSRHCNAEASRLMVTEILSSDAPSLLSKGELNWFSRLIWEANLSDELTTREWIVKAGQTFWQNLMTNASYSDIFHLLLTLWQVDEEFGSRIGYVVGRRLLSCTELKDEPEALPLLGFVAHCGLQSEVVPTFSPAENIDKLIIYPAVPRLLFSLFYLQETKPDTIPDFVRAILTNRRVGPAIALLVAEHQLPWKAPVLKDILVPAKGEARVEKEDIYDRMILLFLSMQPKTIYLNTMLSGMCSPQFIKRDELAQQNVGEIERQEAATRSRVTIWLNNAIDRGIFSLQKTEHPITRKTSQLISLNRDNPTVVFAIDTARDFLRALRDAQKDKGWADSAAWDAAITIRCWKEEPLLPLEVRYWKRVLLQMGAVEVEYHRVDGLAWITTFRVDDKHPLVKSLTLTSY